MSTRDRLGTETRSSDIAMSRGLEPAARQPQRAPNAVAPGRPPPASSAQAALGNAAMNRRMQQQAQAGNSVAPGARVTGTAPAAPAGEAAAAASPAPAAPAAAELLMPAPPPGLTEQDQARLTQVQTQATEAATAEATMPPAEESVSSARAAVTEPEAETEARAQAEVVGALDERPPPSPEIEELCEHIYAVIRAKRPPDEESLVKANPQEMASEAGGQLGRSVDQQTQGVEGSYDALEQPAEGQPAQQPQPLETPPETVETPEIGASAAAPSPVPAESVSLDADVAANQARMDEAGMNSEAASLVQSGPIAEARAAQGELSEMAERDPAEVLAEQAAAIAQAGEDMAALQARAEEALQAARGSTVAGVSGQQTGMVGTEEQMRAQAGQQMQAIYNEAQAQVDRLLEPLPRTAMARWDAGITSLSTAFKSRLKKVEDWIKERHGGGWGVFVSAWDWLTGLPDWVTEEYDLAEKEFGDGTCTLIRDISRDVNAVIATCEGLIETARSRIDTVVQGLPDGLREWAQGEQTRLGEQLEGLKNKATLARDDFNRDLVERASSAVQEVRQQIHGLRQAAGGLVGRIASAVNRFLEDPAKFIIEGLLELVGISPPAFWAVVARIQSVIEDIANDPLAFANNLMAAVGQGFQQFFDNIGTHLLQGMLNWLFSKLGEVGVTLPRDLSLKSVITLFLQVMGITWPRIRKLLAKHIGEENVALIERAWEVVSTLLQQGPEGLFELLKDKLNPQMILDQVLDAAIRFVTEAVITRVTARILLLFNPAGAIIQAIEAIYRVLKWVFQNAARIFSLIETVVNGAAALLKGDIGGMASAVEQALVKLIGPVLGFLADYVGLGGIPEAIKDTILGLQNWVEGILDRIIGWLAEQGRRLLRAVGLGGKEEPGAEGAGGIPSEVGETVRFGAAGEAHRLWVQLRGAAIAIMVASRETPVADHLGQWEQKLAADPKLLVETKEDKEDDSKRKQAQRLIGAAKQKLGLTEKEAGEANKEIKEATQKQTPAETAEAKKANDETKSAEQNLAQILVELFTLFGEKNAFTHPIYALIGKQLVKRNPDGMDELLVQQLPKGYTYKGEEQGFYHIQRTRGMVGQIPAVHLDEQGILREGERKLVKDLSWLLTQQVIALVQAENPAPHTEDKLTFKWAAVFATTGAQLMREEAGQKKALTLGAIWQLNQGAKAQALVRAQQAILKTLAGDKPATPAMQDEAADLAEGMLERISTIELFFVTPTIIPRDVPANSPVKTNSGVAKSKALYEHIARESKARLLTLAPPEIKSEIQVHHVVPLYLGGTHEARNLVQARGDAKVAENVAATAHKLLHDLIDQTSVTFFVDQQKITSTLDFTSLSQKIPASTRKILIGTLYENGYIKYRQVPLNAPVPKSASSE
jgi:hypothetical protein